MIEIPNDATPRQEVLDLYWTFAARRHAIFEKRIAGEASPWTSDPILSEYKFCNVFRATDRVSQFMIQDVCYPHNAGTPEDKVFQIVAFRMFSKPATWQALRQLLGSPPRIEHLETGEFNDALDRLHRTMGRLYTGAFILCATKAYGFDLKHQNHAALFHDMFVKHDLAEEIIDAPSLEEVYDALHAFPLMGDFMSYQTAIDLNYSNVIDFSENDFTKPGPGAIRGLAKVFRHFGENTPEQLIMWMVENQEIEFERLGLPFNGLWGRPLHAIDCQGLFCEIDKYTRVAMPELRNQRSRIKARFTPNPESLPVFLPPKWNVKVPSAIEPTDPSDSYSIGQ